MPRERATRRRSRARTLEAREQELTLKAYDLAERQIEEGTASSQTIAHFLRMGSTRELVEQERIRGQIEVDRVKAEQLEGQKRIEAMYVDALDAMRSYSGQTSPPQIDRGD